MTRTEQIRKYWAGHWLMLLIAAQPLLDCLAYWTRSEEGTAAGVIRLAIMLAMPLHLVITRKYRKKIIIPMAVIALFCIAHAAKCYMQGYINMYFDLSYMAKTAQIPIMAICLTHYITDERSKEQVIKGLLTAAFIGFGSILLACLTGTENDTYGPGLGISGWVIDDNRCANSIIMVTMATALVYWAVRSENKWLNWLVPAAAAFALIMNGTKACYYSIFAICVGFAGFLLLDKWINKRRLNARVITALLLTAVISAAVYPITPRYKVSMSQAQSADRVQNELEMILADMGYDINTMTDEEKLANPVIVKTFGDYYYKIIWSVLPDMFNRFSYEEILTQYGWTTDAQKLISTRLMKRSYVGLIWAQSDPATKLLGIEVSDPWFNAGCDLENDWPALFYYYGYLGSALYIGFILYFVFLILRRLRRDFKATYEPENFYLLMLFALHMGLAEFSGAVLRRPNVSIYTAMILALIYYKTATMPEGQEREIAEVEE